MRFIAITTMILVSLEASATLDYLYIYNTNQIAVLPGVPVSFNNSGPISAAFTYIPGDSAVLVNTAGVYKITYSVTSAQVNQFAIFVDGLIDLSTVYSVGGQYMQNTGQAIVTLPANVIITLRSVSVTGLLLPVFLGGRQFNVNASLIMERFL